jgi:molybdopterin-binding protein
VTIPALVVEHVSLRLDAFAIRNISFALDPGQVFVILGPSGAGKSVLLETIAGFHWPESGRIQIAGRDVTHAAPETRRIGLMFQDYALFPHLTVAQNINFGFRFRPNSSRQARHPGMEDLLARLDLEGLAKRKPETLSGGEKQRVALARALAMEPVLFLFDEPLSALDARTRGTLREELRTFLRELGIAAIYVTHDQTEALTLAHKIAVIRDGELLQIGTPPEIFNAPVNEFVASFVGVENVIEGHVLSTHAGIATIALTPEQKLEAVESGAALSPLVLACIRPEDVALQRTKPIGSSVRNQFRGRIVSVEALGPLLKIKLDCGFLLVAYVTKQSYLDLDLTPGTQVVASVKATAVHLIGRP